MTKMKETMVKIEKGLMEFYRLFGIAAFASFLSWVGYGALARVGLLPNFEISLEGMYWVIFVEFVTIMSTVFVVRLQNGDYNKD